MPKVFRGNAGNGRQERADNPRRLSEQAQTWCLRAIALGLVLCNVYFVWRSYDGMGLFIDLGTDYALYLSQAKVMAGSDPGQIYNLAAMDQHYRELLNTYNRDPVYRTWTSEVIVGPVPYPPIFAWAMQPFTRLSPPASFALWFSLNVCVALAIAWRLAGHCGKFDKATVVLLFLGSFPVVLSLYVGQIQILLAWCVTEVYLALRMRKDFQAGLWLGCLLLKPHYGILLGPLLLWKRRWTAVAGVAVTGSIIVGGSILGGGLEGLLAYPSAFSGLAQFRGDDPTLMLNWRSAILDVYPTIYGRNGTLLAIALGLATVAGLAWIWRGPWMPDASEFPVKILLTLVGTLIATFHSHPYGAALLAMPLVAVLFSEQSGRFGWLAGVGIVVPTLTLTLGYSETITSTQFYQHLVVSAEILKAVMFAMFGYFFVSLGRLSFSRGRSIGNENKLAGYL